MKTAIRKMGNSQGIIIPKPILAQVGLVQEADLSVENGSVVLRPIRRNPRKGWAQASERIAQAGDDAMAWPDFENVEDQQWKW